MTIAKIIAMVPPPRFPIDVPAAGSWALVESELGVSLPKDYQEFIETYGSGRIAGFVWILNPFAQNANLNLKVQLERQSQIFAELRDQGEVQPFKWPPEGRDLIPCAITDNGDVIFWEAKGMPSEWSIVVNESRSPEWQRFSLSFGDFFAELLSGKVVSSIFPDVFSGGAYSFEVAPV